MMYYSLTAKGGNSNVHTGERVYNANPLFSIGQLTSSNIRIPCPDDILPQCFCVIVKNSLVDGWQLIRKSDFYSVSVNEAPVEYICNLHDGDVISVCDNTFVFNAYSDDKYIEGLGVVSAGSSLSLLSVIVVVLIVAIGVVASVFGFQKYIHNQNHFTSDDNTEIISSVHKIVVGEILFQRHTPEDAEGLYQTIDSIEPDSISVGTCFFTRDSLCVTARHCVEAWIDYDAWGDNTDIRTLPKQVQWAVMSEQSQLEEADTLYRIVSRCQVLHEDSCIYSFTSDMCSYNKSRDIIARMGNDGLPWRIIYPLYSRKDVELGDFAFVKTCIKGAFELATEECLSDMNDDEDGETRIYGFPKTNHGNLWDYQTVSHINLPEKEDGQFVQCLQLTVNGTSGFSGSPVICKKKGKMLVVGIFSKIDDFADSKNVFYAVPATEVSQYNPEKANETKQYRR